MALLASHAQCRDLVVSGRPDPCVLLELEEKVLGEVLRDGVSIKGPLDGDAVLCTREATFDLKTVETTNSLLLVPEGEPSTSRAVAASAARSHIELIRAAPRWEGLDAALAATSYGDDDHEAENEKNENFETGGYGNEDGTGDARKKKKSSGVFSSSAASARSKSKSALLLSFPQLLQRVQASETELRAELAARGAFSWRREGESDDGNDENAGGNGGREAKRSKTDPSPSSSPPPPPLPAVRILDPSFAASMLDFLLLTAAARGWRPHALPTEDLVLLMTSPRSSPSSFDDDGGACGAGPAGGGGGGGYRAGIVRHALRRWSSRKRAEGGGGGARASDDGGGGTGSPFPSSFGGETSGGGGGAGAPPSQRRSAPSPFSSAAPELFDEDLREAAPGRPPPPPPPLPPLLSLDEATVLRHEARKLLSASPTWPEGAFAAAWREALEALGVEVARPAVSLDLSAATSGGGGGGGGALAGLATLLPAAQQGSGQRPAERERTVVRLDASALPRDPRSRFAALFACKPRWTKDEIAPYLSGAAVAPGTPGGMGALLLAHARASQSEPDAPVFFSAR